MWSAFALTTPTRKLILDTRTGVRRAFDLERDPGETDDVAAAEGEALAPLCSRLDRERGRSIVGEVLPGDAARIRERLRRLGYIE